MYRVVGKKMLAKRRSKVKKDSDSRRGERKIARNSSRSPSRYCSCSSYPYIRTTRPTARPWLTLRQRNTRFHLAAICSGPVSSLNSSIKYVFSRVSRIIAYSQYSVVFGDRPEILTDCPSLCVCKILGTRVHLQLLRRDWETKDRVAAENLYTLLIAGKSYRLSWKITGKILAITRPKCFYNTYNHRT